MTRLGYTISTIALTAALSAASPALANTTAAELWEEWQALAALTGQTVSADVTTTDTGLTLTNYTSIFEDENVVMRGAIDEVQLIENPDGTISVAYSELYSITFTFEVDPGDPPGNIELQMRHENLDILVSGDADARVYTYSADQLTISEGAIWGGGDVVLGGSGGPPAIDLDVVMTDVSNIYQLTGTDPDSMRFTSEGSIGGLSMALEVTSNASRGGQLKAALVMGPSQSVSSGTVLALGGFDQFADNVPEDFDLSGTTTYDSLGFEMLFLTSSDTFEAIYSNTGGSIEATISPEMVTFDIMGTGMSTRVSGSEIPVPVDISIGRTELSMAIPLAAGDDPQDMGLRMSIQDLVVGETLLGLIDPGRAIPRNPSSLLLDVTGQVQVFIDLITIDPETNRDPPGELRSLSVNELRIAVGGAELTGTADLTFAPGQAVPMPVGSADLQLSGGNALLDALMAGGLVPNEQGAFVRGAANVFARPGALPDTLETTVQFGADGSITANGIPLQ